MIFNMISGMDTSDATAAAEDIESGKTAYVNGEKVTGAIPKTAVQVSATPKFEGTAPVSGKITMSYAATDSKRIIGGGTSFSLGTDAANMGDASASDVASGKTFTSKAGLKVTGTKVDLDTSDATAAAEDIASGKTAYVNGEKVTGTHECAPGLDTSDATASASDILSGKTAYAGGEKITGTIETIGHSAPTISVSDEGKITSLHIIQKAGYVTSGQTSSTKQLPTQAAQTIVPGTADQTIDSGKYLTGAQTIQGDGNLLAENIVKGVSIFGVAGTHTCPSGLDTSDATAAAEDIASGKTAYVNGEKLTGTHTCPAAPSGTVEITANGTHDVSAYASANVNVPSTGLDTSDADATADDILLDKTAYVGGEKITGTLDYVPKGNVNNYSWITDSAESASVLTIQNKKYLKIEASVTTPKALLSGAAVAVGTLLSNLGNATAANVAKGKTFTSAAGLLVTGTHECASGLDTSDATAAAEDIASGKTAYVNGEKVTGTHVCDPGLDTSDATASASDILSGKTAYGNGAKMTGTIPSKAAAVYTPGTAGQTIASGQYLSGDQTIQGDANLVAGNIKSGVSIFGVAGSYSGSGAGDSPNNCEAHRITSETDVIPVQGTGAVKVWGYGAAKGSYTTTIYAFVGDGYYSGSYSTPSKTDASFSISGGTLSGLPSGLTALDLLVTIGI